MAYGISTWCYIGKVWRCLKLRKGICFTKFLEGESSRMWGGIHMVVILLASLILWDHHHPSNHFIFSYIIMDFSWKSLSKIEQRIVERIGWKLGEGSCCNWCLRSSFVHQYFVDHLHTDLEQVYVFVGTKGHWKGTCNIKAVWLYLPLLLNIIRWHVSFP